MKYFLELETLRKILKADYGDEVYLCRSIGLCMVGADYSKFALGFY